MAPLKDESFIIKHFPNAFRDTELHQLLNNANIEEVIICCAKTHICIDTSTRVAFDLGHKYHIISYACATRDLQNNDHTVKAIEVQAAFRAALQVPFAQVSPTEQYLNSH